jgi:dimethylaniline monooxygenase (N-oxide forming)
MKCLNCFGAGESKVTEVDSVILATGYEVDFGFLDKSICWGKNNEVQLYKYMFNPKLKHPETLCFIGLIQAFGPAIPISEMQARWHVQLLLNKCKPLPSVSKMQADIAEKRTEIDRRYFKGARHTMQVDWVPFMDEIASQFGAKPNLFKYFFTDPILWATLYFGPCLPYQYRLNGPHPWSGAKQAIYTVEDRVRDALKTRCQDNDKQGEQHVLSVCLKYIKKAARNYLHLNSLVAVCALLVFSLGFLLIRNY